MPKTQAHRAPAVVPRHASDQLRKAFEPAPKPAAIDRAKPAKPVEKLADNKEIS